VASEKKDYILKSLRDHSVQKSEPKVEEIKKLLEGEPLGCGCRGHDDKLR